MYAPTPRRLPRRSPKPPAGDRAFRISASRVASATQALGAQLIVSYGDAPRRRRAAAGRAAGGSPRRRRVPPGSSRSARRPTPRRPPAVRTGPGFRARGRRPPAGRLRRTAPPGPLPHAPDARPSTLPARPGPIVLIRSPDRDIDRPISHCATSDGSMRGGTNGFLCFPRFPAEARPPGRFRGHSGRARPGPNHLAGRTHPVQYGSDQRGQEQRRRCGKASGPNAGRSHSGRARSPPQSRFPFFNHG